MPKRHRHGIAQLPAAEKLSGLCFTATAYKLMLDDLNEQLAAYGKLRAIPIDNGVPPARS